MFDYRTKCLFLSNDQRLKIETFENLKRQKIRKFLNFVMKLQAICISYFSSFS